MRRLFALTMILVLLASCGARSGGHTAIPIVGAVATVSGVALMVSADESGSSGGYVDFDGREPLGLMLTLAGVIVLVSGLAALQADD